MKTTTMTLWLWFTRLFASPILFFFQIIRITLSIGTLYLVWKNPETGAFWISIKVLISIFLVAITYSFYNVAHILFTGFAQKMQPRKYLSSPEHIQKQLSRAGIVPFTENRLAYMTRMVAAIDTLEKTSDTAARAALLSEISELNTICSFSINSVIQGIHYQEKSSQKKILELEKALAEAKKKRIIEFAYWISYIAGSKTN